MGDQFSMKISLASIRYSDQTQLRLTYIMTNRENMYAKFQYGFISESPFDTDQENVCFIS